MKQVILDTSFILSCIRKKIDFFEDIEMRGIQILVPEQTIDELMGLGAQVALSILEKNKFKIIKISGKDADSAIINFTKENPGVIVATLDAVLQKKTKSRRMVIRGKKKIEII